MGRAELGSVELEGAAAPFERPHPRTRHLSFSSTPAAAASVSSLRTHSPQPPWR